MKWILRLYPRAWRQRYEEEMLALLEQHHSTWRTGFDLFRGAWEAQLDGAGRRQQRMTSSQSSHPLTLAGGTLAGVAIIVVLMLYGILSYPSSIQGVGLTSFVLLCVGLL